MLTRKSLLRAILSLQCAARGEWVLFRYLLPKRMKGWNADPLNLVTFTEILGTQNPYWHGQFPFVILKLESNPSFDGGSYIQKVFMEAP